MEDQQDRKYHLLFSLGIPGSFKYGVAMANGTIPDSKEK
jgi:hypothetical protein